MAATPVPTGSRSAPLLLLLLALATNACRDEQAGPRPRSRSQTRTPAAAPQGVRTVDAAPPDLTYRSGATWAGGAVTYLGTRLTHPTPTPGQQLTLTHYFLANGPQPTGYQFFTHVVEANSGQLAMNLDHELQGGGAPLGSWPAGKVIEDSHAITMPPTPMKLRVLLGFWQGDQRLPVDNPAAHDGTHRMLGPLLEGEPQKLPEYHAARAERPPKLDGVLDDPAWQNAPTVELVGSFDGRKPMLRTVARLAWDDRHLYVAFDCEDPDAWGTLTRKDDPIYNEEVVEVFLDANGDGRSYNELQVSPNNVNFDASFVARRSDLKTAMAWESGMKSAVQVRGVVNDPSDRDQGWSAEMQIPIANLTEVPNVPPRRGERWRFNLYRLEHIERRGVEGQAFSPLFVGDFHHLPRFGWLVFD